MSRDTKDIFKEPPLKAELSIEEIVKRQIERTNVAASYDKYVFAANVGVLKSMLPKKKREEVELKGSEYMDVVQTYKYKYNCGVKIGTPEHPIMGSPELMEVVDVDWDRLYELVLDAFEESGISWPPKPETIR